MKEMQEEYRRHVEDIVRNDLSYYVSIVYDNERWGLAGRLVRAVCQWYQRGVVVGKEVCGFRNSTYTSFHNS
jgi:hypothetical protein